ncbi:MAG: hypothetical protein GYB31_21100 [Bacteroidetes bacterium]|nr:hypothetical protein [Bacteroidota bacterium]
MKRPINVLVLFGLLLGIGITACQSPESTEGRPVPTEINPNQIEGGEQSNAREDWHALIHRAAPGTDWKAIDRETLRNLVKERQKLRDQAGNKILETLANGNLTGEWVERGSQNQAGNLVTVDFDPDNNHIYGVSAGGIVWRGNLNGSNWNSLNDDTRFDTKVIKVIPNGSGGKRILVSQDKYIWYSDDNGASWNQSNLDVDFYDGWGGPKELVALDDANNTLYYLAHTWDAGPWSPRMWLYASNDRGANFQRIQVFNPISGSGSVGFHTCDLWAPLDQAEAFVLHQGRDLYEINGTSVNLLNTNTDLPTNVWTDFEGYSDGSTRVFYALANKSDLYRSDDDGQNWTFEGNTNVDTWSVGIAVSPFDPDDLYYGAVECYRSTNSGNNWSRVTPWWRYYTYPDSLHADIMDIKSFEKTDGTEFILVANHGGLHVSYNNLVNTTNIGDFGLNISQYYDVRTDPVNSNYIYGGTQDQGFQKTDQGNASGSVYFDQVVSGDYGHFAFSQNGYSLWKVYPFGNISYYNNAQSSSGSSSYNLGGSNPPVADWIFPTCETAIPGDNSIYVAGGNISGGSGSYLITLTANTSAPYTISGSQFSYNFYTNSNSGSSAISAIEADLLNPQRIYVSTDDGTFFYTSDGGSSWNVSSLSNGPGEYYLYGACIYASQVHPNRVLFAGSGYSNPGVFISNDGGQTFTAMDNGLPNSMVHEIVANTEETLYFAATDVGPYVYVISEGTWYPMMGTDAPLQRYYSVEYVDSEELVRFGTYGRGIWDFEIQSQPLPVELNRFTASLLNEKDVLLEWQTETEINSDFFLIERSEDGENFRNIGELPAAGNSTQQQNYQFTDQETLAGLNYYRLKQFDFDGSFSYSPIRSVRVDVASRNLVQLSPNPVQSGSSLFIRGPEGIRLLHLWRADGRESVRYPIGSDHTIENLPLPRGLYFYQVYSSAGRPVGEAGRLFVQ